MSNLQNSASEAQMIELLNSIKIPIMGAGGGFAPIGTENYFEGTTAPAGWVLCDGSVLNIADYPELATYYASHYGASNHFGGDGITTFAVPTKEGMPNSDVYNENEQIVSVWKETVDGVVKQKPVYRKLVTGLSVSVPIGSGSSPWTTLCSISNLDKIKSLVTYGTNDMIIQMNEVTKTNDAVQVIGTYEARTIGSAVIQYTKTTDSWTLPTPGHSADGNGVFCVKATLSDANLDVYTVYSPNERQVGWWQEEIDGVLKQKPLYRTTLFRQGAGDIDAPQNLDKLTNLYVVSNTTVGRTRDYYQGNADSLGVYYTVSTNKITIRGGSTLYTDSNAKETVVIEYTKTTDDWQVV